MAVDKLVDSAQLDADLTSVANAIRTKGGTSAQLAFPAGFVSAIDAIPSGGGGSPTGILTFDFTKGVYAEEAPNLVYQLSGATQDSYGLHIAGASARAHSPSFNLLNCVVEISVGSANKSYSSGHGRFATANDNGDGGFIYRSTGKWSWYSGSGWTDSSITDPDAIANSTIVIEYASDGKVSVSLNGTKIINNASNDARTRASFGAGTAAFYNVTILKCIIYTAEAYALKLLMGS